MDLQQKMGSWCWSQGRIPGHTESVKRAVDLLEKDRTALRMAGERTGSEKSSHTKEKRGLAIYYIKNKRVEYSGLKGGEVDVFRWVLADLSLHSGGGIFVLMWLSQNCHGNTGGGDFSWLPC